MFSVVEALRQAIFSIKAHGFRSFLTTLGIIIGVASTIAVVSIIQGLNHSINQQFEGFGTNSISIRSHTPHEDWLKGKIARITYDDTLALQKKLDGIKYLTPILASQQGGTSEVGYNGSHVFARVVGTTYSYQNVQNVDLKYGRFLSHSDNQTRRKVAVIGEQTREELHLPENPVGKFVHFSGEWIKIIGLAEPKGAFLGMSQDNFVAMPFNTMHSLNGNDHEPDIFIQLQLSDLTQLENIKSRISSTLRQNHNLPPNEDDDFKIETPEQLTEGISRIISTLTIVLGGIVSISLFVGGIGIMNIMLVSVTERTRDIGICKAIGAKRHNILLQFLFEAIILSLLGGGIGLLIGFGLGMLAAALIPALPPSNVPFWAIATAFGFSASVGVLFGILPAAKAANLDPIEALRHE